jgi:hypothetical protein
MTVAGADTDTLDDVPKGEGKTYACTGGKPGLATTKAT